MEPLDKNSAEFQTVFSADVRNGLQAAGALDAAVAFINADSTVRQDIRAYYLTILNEEPRADAPSYNYKSAEIAIDVSGNAGLFTIDKPTPLEPAYVGTVFIAASEFVSAERFVTTLSHELSGHFTQRYVNYYLGSTSSPEDYAGAYLQTEGFSHLRQAQTAEIVKSQGGSISSAHQAEVQFLQQERARIDAENPTATPEAKQLLLVSSFVNRLSAPDSEYSRLAEAMEAAAGKIPLVYTSDGQIYGVTVGRDSQGQPFLAYEKGDIVVEGIVAVNGMCRVYDAGALRTETAVTPAHKLAVRTFDVDQTQNWSERTESFESDGALQSEVTIFDDGSQRVQAGGTTVEFAIDGSSRLVPTPVTEINGTPLEQAQGEAIARELQANGATPEMIANDSPWLNEILVLSNPGLSEGEMPAIHDFTLSTAIEAMLSGDTSALGSLNDALQAGSVSTPSAFDSSTDFGFGLDLTAGDGERDAVTLDAGSIAASGIGAYDADVRVTNALFETAGTDGALVDALDLDALSGWISAVDIDIPEPQPPEAFSYADLGFRWPGVRIDGFGFTTDAGVTAAFGMVSGDILGVDTNFDYRIDFVPPVPEASFEPYFFDFYQSPFPFEATQFAFSGAWQAVTKAPVVLDLDGDGVELVSPVASTAAFDMNDDGVRELTGWAAPDDGLLAYDHDENNLVTRADEISFTAYNPGAATDLEGLSAFDTNQNGKLDAADSQWAKFGIWRDANQDGISQAGEFLRLADYAIASIDLVRTGPEYDQDGAHVYGALNYTRADNSQGAALDVLLSGTSESIEAQATAIDVWALDLDGDGVWSTSKDASEVLFDADNDGYREVTAWLNAQDGMLAVDWNGDGRVDSASELVTDDITATVNRGSNSIQALDQDTNGRLDSADESYADLKVWRDINGDGLTEARELKSLAELGVAYLDYASGTYATADDAGRVLALAHLEADGQGVEVSEAAGGMRLRGEDGSMTSYLKTDDGLLVAPERGADAGRLAFYSDVGGTLGAGVWDLTLLGASGINGSGNELNNRILGNPAANRLEGGAGNDTLAGGAGADTLKGGTGDDTYVVEDPVDVIEVDSFVSGYRQVVSRHVELRSGMLFSPVTKSWGSFQNHPVTIVEVRYVPILGVDPGLDTVISSVNYWLGAGLENLALSGTDSLAGAGNSLANYLTGTSASNTLIGGSGNDTLDGNGDADWMEGRSGDDTFIVDDVNDVASENTAVGGTGVDTVVASVSVNLTTDTTHFVGVIENITLTGNASLSATGNSSGNVMVGNSGNNSLSGAAGNDTLDGGAGNDTLVGGAGNDTYIVNIDNVASVRDVPGEGIDTVLSWTTFTLPSSYVMWVNGEYVQYEVERLTLLGSGNTAGTGNALYNLITGNDGDNSLDGDSGVDTLLGGAGNDTLVGADSADSLVGGSGDDYYILQGGDQPAIVEVAGGGTDVVRLSSDPGNFVAPANIETVLAYGAFAATGNALDNLIEGSSGGQSLSGGAGNDTILGKNGEDTLTGGSGNDVLDGGGHLDSFAGGLGDDVYYTDRDDEAERIFEAASEGTDTVFYSMSADFTLSANVENLTFTYSGTSGDQDGVGNASPNVFVGNARENTFTGLAGNDVYHVDLADTVVEASGGGADTVVLDVGATSGTYTLPANIEHVTLEGTGAYNVTGSTAANQLTGNTAANSLDGGSGNDTLTGDAGNDTLEGGAGNDSLVGGLGDDLYVRDSSGDVVNETLGGGGDGYDIVESSVSYTFAASSGLEELQLSGAALNGTGNELDNLITGTSGNNSLSGGTGNDTLVGGAGNDTYVVDSNEDVVMESGADTLDVVQSSAPGFTLSSGVENLTLTGSASINGAGNELNNLMVGNSAANVLDGLASADTMRGAGGNDSYYADDANDVVDEDTATGGAGSADTVYSLVDVNLGDTVHYKGTLENVVLLGGANLNATGNGTANVLTGNAGTNVLTGLAGNDTYYADLSDTVVEASGAGTDTVILDVGTSSGNYVVPANVEHMTLLGTGDAAVFGSSVPNLLIGNSGANLLYGDAGNDTLQGGTGDDIYVLDAATDLVQESIDGGYDLVQIAATYTLTGEVEDLALTGTGNINGRGNSLANFITGTTGNNVLNGDLGTDTLIGSTGNDTYVVDSNDDMVIESGSDTLDLVQSTAPGFTLSSGVENLTLTGNAAIDGTGNELNNLIVGNAGANVLNGQTGADTMRGAGGNDSYYVDDAADVVDEDTATGGAGSADTAYSLLDVNLGDTVHYKGTVENVTLLGSANLNATGNGAANVLTGNAGANVLTGLAGNDIYYVDLADTVVEASGAGTDTVMLDAGTASGTYTLPANIEHVILEGTGAYNVTGSTAANQLTGNTAANSLDGGSGNDTLSGGDGNDTLTGGADNDSLVGGLGDDLYVRDSSGDVVNETLGGGGGYDIVQSSVNYTFAANSGLEELQLTGGAGNGTGNELDNLITGTSGNNVLSGGAGNDTLVGGAGNDTYVVDSNDDVVIESGADTLDLVQSTAPGFTLGAGLENLTLTSSAAIKGSGNELNNLIVGNSGANVLDGLVGADTMRGAGGNDSYYVDDASDVVDEDSATGGAGSADTVYSLVDVDLGDTVHYKGTLENVVLLGGANLNATGSTGGNALTGNSETNVLDGGAGNDTLDGGLGADILVGGTGNDTYIIDTLGDTPIENASAGVDTVQSWISYSLPYSWEAVYLENLVLLGTGNFTASGNDLSNVITGNSGNNVLEGGLGGADTLQGGLGDDYYYISAFSGMDTVVEAAGAGNDTISLAADNGSLTYSLPANVELVEISGSEGTLTLTGNSSSNEIVVYPGFSAATILGGGGNDTITAHDYFWFYGFTYTVSGEAGDDIYVQTVSSNPIFDESTATSSGTDTVVSQGGLVDLADASHFKGAIEIIRYELATDVSSVEAWGNSLNNTFYGTYEVDFFGGRGGNDTYYIDPADVVIEVSGGGTDTVYLDTGQTTGTASLKNNGTPPDPLPSAGSELWYVEHLTLLGSSDFDVVGSSAANVIAGNAGNNVLDGGAGNDSLTGGAGEDLFVFSTPLSANVDHIVDFAVMRDKIVLDDAIFAAIGPALSPSQFRAAPGATAGGDLDDRVILNLTNGVLYYDADGSGAASSVAFAWIDDSAARDVLSASDFLIS